MSFDYGGVDFGATVLRERAERELRQSGEISNQTIAALEANRVMPPMRKRLDTKDVLCNNSQMASQ